MKLVVLLLIACAGLALTEARFVPVFPHCDASDHSGRPSVGICAFTCHSHKQCQLQGKSHCCQTACGGTSCTGTSQPTTQNPKGKCPSNPPGTFGICVEECFGDNDCAEGELCCSNGCGHVCKTAVNPITTEQPTTTPEQPTTTPEQPTTTPEQPTTTPVQPPADQCPPVDPDTAGICVEECFGDDNCPKGELCCSNGCGHVCTKVSTVTISVQPSTTTSPKDRCPPLPPHSVGLCVEECGEGCTNGQICCSNGCGHVCKDPVD